LLERGRRLLTENIEALREAFGSVRARRAFRIDAIVILPDLPPLPLDVTTERFRFFKPLALDQVVICPRHRAGRVVINPLAIDIEHKAC
jgi:hypothetical protein